VIWLREFLVAAFEDRAARAAVMFAAALVAAVLLDRICTLGLRGLTRRTRSNIDDAVIAALHRPVIVSVLLIGGWQALLLFHDVSPPIVVPAPDAPQVEGAPHRDVLMTLRITSRILVTVAVLVWTTFALRATGALLRGAASSDRVRLVQPTSYPLFNHGSKLVVLAVAVYLALQVWSVDATGWLASAGVLGLVLGLAAQDSLANLFAGAFILADGPYKVGDYILLDTGERGMVTFIGLRSTRLMTRDDIEIIIPNSVMGRAKIVNESGGPARAQRVRVKVGVAYGSDLDLVREELLAAAYEVNLVVAEPRPRVRFRTFGDSALQHELLCWIPDAELRGRALHELNTCVCRRFAAAGIEIPFPQRVLHLQGAATPSGSQT